MNSYREEKREGIGMNKIIKSTLVVMLMFGMFIATNAFPVSAEGTPAGNEVEFRGKTTSIHVDDVVDDGVVVIQYDIYIDPTFDYFDTCNMTVVYNPEMVEFLSVESVNPDYVASSMEITPNQHNVIIVNLPMIASAADGYLTTISVTMKIVNASELIAATESIIKLGLHDDDLNVVMGGLMIQNQDIVEGKISFVMPISITDMKIEIIGLTPIVNPPTIPTVPTVPSVPSVPTTGVTGGMLSWIGLILTSVVVSTFIFKKKETE